MKALPQKQHIGRVPSGFHNISAPLELTPEQWSALCRTMRYVRLKPRAFLRACVLAAVNRPTRADALRRELHRIADFADAGMASSPVKRRLPCGVALR